LPELVAGGGSGGALDLGAGSVLLTPIMDVEAGF